MTDEQLCRAWRTSFTALQQTPGAADLAALAEARAGYLDEIERRNVAGFARWMASGARAGSDLGRFLNTARKPHNA